MPRIVVTRKMRIRWMVLGFAVGLVAGSCLVALYTLGWDLVGS